jgi:hypothetical protein
MKEEEVVELFDKFNEDWVEFDSVHNMLHHRRDLCAFLIIADMFPDDSGDILGAAEHDRVWISAEWEEFCEKATPEIIHDLAACGVIYEDEGLFMFA